MTLNFLSEDYPLEKNIFLVPRFALTIIGFYPETKASIWNGLWAFFNFAVLAYGSYAELYYGISYIPTDIARAMDAICPVASSIVSLLKVCCIWWYRKDFKLLIERVRLLNEAQSTKEKNKIKSFYFAWATRLTAFMMFCGFCTSSSYSLRALVVNYLQYRKGQLVVYDIPFKMTFPEFILEVPYAPWAFLFSHWHGYITVCCFIGGDGFFLAFCCYFTTLLKSLAIDIKAEQAKRTELAVLPAHDQEEAEYLRLSGLIDRHNEIYELVARLSVAMEELTLGHFVSSGLIIATSVICMLLIPGLGILTYVAYTTAVLVELFVYCIGGTMMFDAGEEVYGAAYSSHWYLRSVKVQKQVLLLIMRAQKMLVVKVPFFAPSLPALTQILRFVGSLVALAKSIL